MKLTLEYENRVALEVESDGEGRYKIKSDQTVSRQDVNQLEAYETEDGLHVLGLICLYFGSNDSREYLTRRLKENEPRS